MSYQYRRLRRQALAALAVIAIMGLVAFSPLLAVLIAGGML